MPAPLATDPRAVRSDDPSAPAGFAAEMPPVAMRAYKPCNLHGGTLVVSIPHGSAAGMLVTDYLLDQRRMDQVAALDSPALPPLAMVWKGKPRFPLRVHADPAQPIAVLRGEFSPPWFLARALALEILAWARAQGVARIVALDGILSDRPLDGPPELWFCACGTDARRAALDTKLPELEEGALAGVPASLLLEARFQGAQVLALLAELREPIDEPRGAVAFAKALQRLLPDVRIDEARLEADLARVERAVRQARERAERTQAQMRDGNAPASAPPMYG
jgi:uncharacterized protein